MNPTKKLHVSVQRVLNARSNRPELDQSFERAMFESIHKCINSDESPPKEKHVRRILIGTFQRKSARFFWDMAPLLKLQENPIICWKFLGVLHRLLRDGHQQVLADSYKHLQILVECEKVWATMDTHYGAPIGKLSQLIYNRMKFLARNNFPLDLKLTDDELIGDQECVDHHFQLSCELFDSLEDILTFQRSLGIGRAHSLTSGGQCRLAPLVACIQDSSLLYDYIVKILFKLHSRLESAILSGHRQRFLSQYELLKQFYVTASNLQYFKTLIQVPLLNEKPPNFLVASDLSVHVAPRVIMIDQRDSPESEAQGDDILIDLSMDQPSRSLDSPAEVDLMSSSVADASTSQITNTSNEVERLTETVENLSTELAFAKFENARTVQQLTQTIQMLESGSSQKACQHGDLVQRVSELEADLANRTQECDAVKSSLKTTQSGNVKLKSANQMHEENVKKLHAEIDQLKTINAALSGNYDRLEARLKLERGQNDATRVENLMNEISRLKDDNSQLHVQIGILESSIQASAERQRQESLDQSMHDINPENLEEMLMKELSETDRIIKEAALKIDELGLRSRQRDRGVKLEVNEKIAGVCSDLMKAVMVLLKKSRSLQEEIASSTLSAGDHTRREFYKRNSNWTQGLISAANVVAVAAKFLVDAADRVMNGTSRFNELVAAAHEIATSTTQLVVGSKVKSKHDSETLKSLIQSSRSVNTLTGNVVATSKQCSQIMDQEVENLDLTKLSLHQTKRLEMESQVKLLDLENQITKERVRLGILRKQHYDFEAASEDGSNK